MPRTEHWRRDLEQHAGGRARRGARRIALIYATVAALWILVSDRLLGWLARDTMTASTLKGLAYVGVTACLLYVLVERLVSRLEHADLRLGTIIDGMVDAVVVADHRGRVLHANAAARRVRGVRGAQTLEEWLHGDEAQRGLRSALDGHAVADLDVTEISADGAPPRRFGVTLAPLFDGARVEAVVAVLHDVTERREAADELRVASRRKDEFIAMLSHELRNPLAPIQNSVILLERACSVEQAARARQIIRRQVEHLTHIVADLLDVDRINRGSIELRRARLDLRTLVTSAVEDHAGLFAAKGVALTADLPSAPLPVLADPTRVAQSLANLLLNAIKFTPAGGHVSVRALREGDSASLLVRDDGAGIAKELLPHVFEPFTQGEQSLDRRGGGLGLGLALVRGIVELHGGRVDVRSDGAGRGAEVRVTLPLAPEVEPGGEAA